jgi:hypothetical protein
MIKQACRSLIPNTVRILATPSRIATSPTIF